MASQVNNYVLTDQRKIKKWGLMSVFTVSPSKTSVFTVETSQSLIYMCKISYIYNELYNTWKIRISFIICNIS